MRKPLLHRLFGLGKLPVPMRPILEAEGIVLLDEGLSGSITFRNFRAPGKRYGWRRSWFMGSVVVTQQRFAGFRGRSPIINLPLEKRWIDALDCAVESDTTLLVRFDASVFDQQSSGTIEVRFRTEKAALLLEQLRERARAD